MKQEENEPRERSKREGGEVEGVLRRNRRKEEQRRKKSCKWERGRKRRVLRSEE